MAALLALGCAALAAPVPAAVYKWTDASGRVVYSDQPPPGNVQSETVHSAAPPSNPNAVRDMAAKELEFKKRQTEAATKDKKVDTQRAEVNKVAEQCQRTRAQIRQLAAEQIALVRYNEKGEAVYVDDATRRKERGELELWVKANCPN
ncbi:MAG: DUF4124 domain-containing protein [Burkholderiales bacterium]|nr:DUF4124 domain-containing protein [Burkholderiales bacterium]